MYVYVSHLKSHMPHCGSVSKAPTSSYDYQWISIHSFVVYKLNVVMCIINVHNQGPVES